jgi:hypothetical protein
MDYPFTQVIAREMDIFVDNLRHLLIKAVIFLKFLTKCSNDRGLQHFCRQIKLKSIEQRFNGHFSFSWKL